MATAKNPEPITDSELAASRMTALRGSLEDLERAIARKGVKRIREGILKCRKHEASLLEVRRELDTSVVEDCIQEFRSLEKRAVEVANQYYDDTIHDINSLLSIGETTTNQTRSKRIKPPQGPEEGPNELESSQEGPARGGGDGTSTTPLRALREGGGASPVGGPAPPEPSNSSGVQNSERRGELQPNVEVVDNLANQRLMTREPTTSPPQGEGNGSTQTRESNPETETHARGALTRNQRRRGRRRRDDTLSNLLGAPYPPLKNRNHTCILPEGWGEVLEEASVEEEEQEEPQARLLQ